jgi:hypothetical protein
MQQLATLQSQKAAFIKEHGFFAGETRHNPHETHRHTVIFKNKKNENLSFVRCCETETIFSGYDFGKVTFRFQIRIKAIFTEAQFFK